MNDSIDRGTEEAVNLLIQNTIAGSKAALHAFDDLELSFEMWFNYVLSRIGEATLRSKLDIHDDLCFNMDGYSPTLMPVVNQLIPGMTTIGVDLIKPSADALKAASSMGDPMIETFGSMIADDLEGITWVLFTIVEQGHPLKGLRYATAFRDGELTYPPTDPNFTSTYPDEAVHESARGIFIDTRERVLRSVRPDIYALDAKGKLLP